MTTNPEKRLEELDISLPEIQAPVANYLPYAKAGNLVFISGQVPINGKGELVTGRVGEDISVEEAVDLTRGIAVTLLAIIKEAAGTLDNVSRIVKINGSVNAIQGFTMQPLVIDGVSDLMVDVFGERGRHARAAVGTGSLPGNVPVEVEAIVELIEPRSTST